MTGRGRRNVLACCSSCRKELTVNLGGNLHTHDCRQPACANCEHPHRVHCQDGAQWFGCFEPECKCPGYRSGDPGRIAKQFGFRGPGTPPESNSA